MSIPKSILEDQQQWEEKFESKIPIYKQNCWSLSMTGQFLTLWRRAAPWPMDAIIAICDYFIEATVVAGNIS